MDTEKFYSFLIIAITLLEPFSWHIFCRNLCYRITGKRHIKLRYLLMLVLLTLVKNGLSDFYQSSNVINYILNSIGMLFYYFYSVKIYENDKRITFCILSFTNILFTVLEYIYTYLLLIIFKVVNQDYVMQHNLFRVMSFALLYLVSAILLIYFSHLKLEFLQTLKNRKIFNIFVGLLITDCLTFFLFSFPAENKIDQVRNYGSMIFELVLGVYALRNMIQLMNHENEINEYLHCANSQIQILKENKLCSDNARKIVHDSNNHILSIGYLLKNGQVEKAYEYVTQIMPKLDEARADSSEESMLSILLYRKQTEAAQLGISFDYVIGVEDVDMNIIDISTLIFNMSDNAIEYCNSHNLGKSGITYRIYVANDLLYFECFNICNNSIETDASGHFITTKEDKLNHGLGIKIMEECVAKYGGTLEPRIEKGLFIITASFNRNYAIEYKAQEISSTNADLSAM